MGRIILAQAIQKTAARIADECAQAFEKVLEDLVAAHEDLGIEVEPLIPPGRNSLDLTHQDVPFRRTPHRTAQAWPLQP
jgi:hypothetical protein